MPRKQKKYNFIYKTTCIISKKYYIGMHSTDKLEDNYLGSGKVLSRSLNKYGKHNHTIERLFFFNTRKELKKKEEEIVNETLLKDPLNMNLQLGGGGGFLNEDHKSKFIKAGPKSYVNKMKTNPEFLKEHNRKFIECVKKAHSSGKCKYDNFKGKKHTPETIEKMKISQNGKQKGEKNSQFGKSWIYNEDKKKNIKVSKKEIDTFLKLGWKKGRKMSF